MNVLVLGAGGPAGVNVCRALRAGGHQPWPHEDNPLHRAWLRGLGPHELNGDTPDVGMAQPDNLVLKMASTEQQFATFLPKAQTIALCQDKFECGLVWRREELRQEPIHLVDSYERMVFALKVMGFPCWVRARHGAGAKGAICARNEMEALAWFDFWRARDEEMDFIVEEFLPGKDYSWCGIYRDGELLVSFARERLEYLYPHLTPEGLTGTPTIARIVKSTILNEMAEAAVWSVDPNAHGVFCVDLREDQDGVPRPTEINAGRFSTTVGLWSLYDDEHQGLGWYSNFVALAAELAVGDDSRLEKWKDLPEGLTLSRHIDCRHVFSMAEVLA